MYINRFFSLPSILVLSWKQIIGFAAYSILAVVLYEYLEYTWMFIPWQPVTLIGTVLAFYLGFKNNSAYSRSWESRKIWGAIVNASRSWGILVKDFINNQEVRPPLSQAGLHIIHREMIHRHIAWLYAHRRQLLDVKRWEHNRRANRVFRNFLADAFLKAPIEEELAAFLPEEEVSYYLGCANPATQIIAKQSARLRELREDNLLDSFRHMEMEKLLVEFYTVQGKNERIKNYPLPRQYATSSVLMIVIFMFLLPFGLMSSFAELGPHMVWLTVPFATLVGWVYWVMELVGDYAENPFEGLAFDTPMGSLCRTIEIDLLEMLGQKELPPKVEAVRNILL